jgi:hypothetical protein
MGRSVVTVAPTDTGPKTRAAPGDASRSAPAVDDYSDALLKLIPAEVIGVYLAMQSVISNSAEPGIWANEVVFLFGLFSTYFYLHVVSGVKSARQLWVSIGAFFAWALAMDSGPNGLEIYGWHINGTYAGLFLIGYTFIAPKIPIKAVPRKEKRKP